RKLTPHYPVGRPEVVALHADICTRDIRNLCTQFHQRRDSVRSSLVDQVRFQRLPSVFLEWKLCKRSLCRGSPQLERPL
ncbi:hypothetical protein PFISCL1PPCAC_28845, partial [Pristionchus fissidentatus]